MVAGGVIEVIEKIGVFLEAFSEVKFAVLFGSTSKGIANKLSDIDIAVMLEAEDPKLQDRYGYDYRADLSSEFMALLKSDGVDVTILNDASPLIRHEVLRHGKPIAVKDGRAWVEFQLETVRGYDDFIGIFEAHKRRFMVGGEVMSGDINAMLRRLLDLERYIAQMRRFQSYSYEEISSDLEKLWAVEHGLQLCIQLLLDVGNQILAEVRESRIETYWDVIDLLAQRGVIPEEFALRIRGVAGFRNILVHGYAEVNIQEVYGLLQNRLGDFSDFIGHIRRHLAES